MSTGNRPNWTVREAAPADFDAIRALYLDVWGYSRPLQYDQWRFFGSPDGICPMTLAVDGDRLAGAYSLWPVKIRVGGETVAGAQSMDTMTHPDYGRQGVFSTLATACYEVAEGRGFRVLYGFPNPLSYPGFTRKLGWTHTGDMTHWVRPVRPSGHARIPALAAPFANAAARLLPKGRRFGLEIRPGKPAGIESLIDAAVKSYGTCRTERSTAWFDWRYAEAAENNYRWLSAYRDGELVASGAWGRQNAKWASVADNRGHLVELLGGDRQGLQAVLSAIVDDAWQAGAILLETICNVESITAALRRAGFFRHREAPFIVRGLGDRRNDGDILDHANWNIMGGDIDTF